MDQNGIIGLVALAISIIGSILGVINHRRIRSHCCGKDLIASIDVETTDTKEDLKIKIPKRSEDVNLPPSPEPPRINRIIYDC
jgi:hypothetical protein